MRSSLNIWEFSLGELALASGMQSVGVTKWHFLPSTTLDVVKKQAMRTVYDFESFTQFLMASGLPYFEARDLWSAAWDDYNSREAQATGN